MLPAVSAVLQYHIFKSVVESLQMEKDLVAQIWVIS